MKKRKFIKSIGLGLASTAAIGNLFFPNIVSSKKKHTWVAVSAFDKAGILGRAFSRICDEITRISNGELNIRLFHANELVSAFESFDVVQSGTCQMGFGSPYYWAGKSPSISLLSGIPFGMNYQEMSSWFYNGDGIKFADKIYNQFNLKFFPAGNTGNQMGGWFNKKIRSANDFKGLKMRMPGLGGQVLGKLGGSPISLPGGQIYENLVSGAIDATEWVGPWNDEAMKFQEAAKYYYYPGMHEPGSTLACGVNKSWFTSLSKSDQLIIKTACDWADTTTMAEYNAKNGAALARLVNESGVKLEKFNDKVYDAFAKGAAEVFDEVQQHSALAKKVHAAFVKGRKEIGAWTNLSDGPYVAQRNRALGV